MQYSEPSRSRTLSKEIGSLKMGVPLHSARSSSTLPAFLLLLHFADNHGAMSVQATMRCAIQAPAKAITKSITCDQNFILGRHRNYKVETVIPVCFSDPHSHRQRRSIENTNGPLRQFLPKGPEF